MLEDSSNQKLLAAWRDGSQPAATILVRRYMVRLMALVRGRMARKLTRRLDPEDIVLSAWRSFFVAVDGGRIAAPDDDDLWPVLVTFSLRKLARQATRHRAGRRDIAAETEHGAARQWQAAVAEGPSPAEAAALFEEVEVAMQSLGPTDREVLTRTLQGAKQWMIAIELECTERSVRRRLQKVRRVFQSRLEAGEFDIAGLAYAAITAHAHSGHEDSSARHDVMEEMGSPTFMFEEIRLQEMAGQGGFGKVYRSRLLTTGEVVAVKFLKKRFWQDRRATESLLLEYDIATSLSHPDIVRHRGWGVSPSGAPFLVMDWIDGPNLRTWLNVHTPSVREIIDCGVAVLQSLAVAHGAGVIHGDLTLTNILAFNGRFLLTDFGFARSRKRGERTYQGGTPGFLAPEQLSDAFGPITPRTDYYGFGCLLHALLTGHPPFVGRDIHETISNVLSMQPAAPVTRSGAAASPRLSELILKCMAKEPSRRPSDLGKIWAELYAIYGDY